MVLMRFELPCVFVQRPDSLSLRGLRPEHGLVDVKELQRIKRAAHLAIGRQRDTRIGHWLGPSISSITRAWENDNADPATNGEFRVLDAWTKASVNTVFDVGAHH